MSNGTTKVTVGPKPPEIDFVKPNDPAKDFGVGAGEPSATEIQFGLWDHLITPSGSVLNAAAENQNVVGADSRRFYIRVRDDSAKGRGFIEVDWWTAFQNSPNRIAGTVHDDPHSVLNLFEVTGSPGVFTSRGLMLVNDQADRGVAPDSGIPSSDPRLGSQAGLRRDTQSNFRVRRCGMHSFVVASYTPKTGKAKPVTVTAPVFLPANKKVAPVQVYVVRTGKGGSPSIPPADLFSRDLPAITETYERIGIWFWAMVSAADRNNPDVEKVTGTPLTYEICAVDPPAGVDPARLDVAGVGALGRAFPAAAPNTLRLFFVSAFAFTDLAFKPLGRAFGVTADPNPAPTCTAHQDPADTVGIGLVQSNRGDDYTAAHELGHLLSDKDKVRKAKLNPNDLLERCIEVSHYRADAAVDMRVNMNLMNDNGPKNPAQKFLDPKRIWDDFDDDMVDQLLNIRSSKFLR